MAAYVAADGSVGGPKTTWKWITEFFMSIYAILALFFTTITNPKALQEKARPGAQTWAQRNGGKSYKTPSGSRDSRDGGGQTLGRGANIRGVRDIGQANCAVGGG